MENLSRIILAIFFSGLLISLIKGGWTGNGGALDWWKAKFLGQPSGTTADSNAVISASTPAVPNAVGNALGTVTGTASRIGAILGGSQARPNPLSIAALTQPGGSSPTITIPLTRGSSESPYVLLPTINPNPSNAGHGQVP